MKNILIFNDISGLGNCSLAANLPIFTKLGHYCMPVVTGAFSCQTGFKKFTCQRNEQVLQCVTDIVAHRAPDAIYVGFCLDNNILQQVEKVLDDTSAFVFVDPILGDNGKLYSVFDNNYVVEMKKVVRKAHCISPNLTEACLLANVDYAELISHCNESDFLEICGSTFADFLQVTGAQNAVITGVECGNEIGNIVLQKGASVRYITNERVQVNYSGTGDAFSSVLTGELLNGADIVKATEIAASFVGKAAKLTQCADRRFGVEFFRVLELL